MIFRISAVKHSLLVLDAAKGVPNIYVLSRNNENITIFRLKILHTHVNIMIKSSIIRASS